MYDFIGVGEVLIDMTPAKTAEGENCFIPKIGGGPVNSACAVSRLGLNAASVGRVGKDFFGRQIKEELKEFGLDTSLIQEDAEVGTTLAFVRLDENGDRDFSFYRKGLADTRLEVSAEAVAAARQTKILHFGSVGLAEEPERTAVLELVQNAKAAGATISYDPNLRFPLWDDAARLKHTVLETLDLADIVKLSDDEADFLFGKIGIEAALRTLRDRFGVKLAIITCGKKGAFALSAAGIFNARAYDVKTIDTTGAGDCFVGTTAYYLLTCGKDISELGGEETLELLRLANAAGSLSTTKRGAIASMPTIEEVRKCMAEAPEL